MTATRFVRLRGRREQPLRSVDAALPVRQARQRIVVREPLDVLGRGRVAQDVLEPARQQRPVHGLRNEVRGARLERAADRLGVLVPGDHDDRHAAKRGSRAQAPADLVAVEPGHVDVEQHDRDVVRAAPRRARPSPLANASASRPTSATRLAEQHAAEILVVGDDRERASWCSRGSCGRSQTLALQGVEQRQRAPPATLVHSSRRARARLRAQSCSSSSNLLRVRQRADVRGARRELVAHGRGGRQIVLLERVLAARRATASSSRGTARRASRTGRPACRRAARRSAADGVRIDAASSSGAPSRGAAAVAVARLRLAVRRRPRFALGASEPAPQQSRAIVERVRLAQDVVHVGRQSTSRDSCTASCAVSATIGTRALPSGAALAARGSAPSSAKPSMPGMFRSMRIRSKCSRGAARDGLGAALHPDARAAERFEIAFGDGGIDGLVFDEQHVRLAAGRSRPRAAPRAADARAATPERRARALRATRCDARASARSASRAAARAARALRLRLTSRSRRAPAATRRRARAANSACSGWCSHRRRRRRRRSRVRLGASDVEAEDRRVPRDATRRATGAA